MCWGLVYRNLLHRYVQYFCTEICSFGMLRLSVQKYASSTWWGFLYRPILNLCAEVSCIEICLIGVFSISVQKSAWSTCWSFELWRATYQPQSSFRFVVITGCYVVSGPRVFHWRTVERPHWQTIPAFRLHYRGIRMNLLTVHYFFV
jgi:hypothetical protein